MTLNNQIMEPWDYYDEGSAWDTGAPWTLGSGTNNVDSTSPSPRTGLKSMRLSGGNGYVRRGIVTSGDTHINVFCGFNWTAGTFDLNRSSVMALFTTVGDPGSITTVWGFQVNALGAPIVFQGNGTQYGAVWTGAAGTVSQNTWNSVRLRIELSTGAWELYFNSVLLATDADGSAFTGTIAPVTLNFGSHGSGFSPADFNIDDVFYFTESGATAPTDVQLRYIVPDADETPADWAIVGDSTVTNGYQALDNTEIDATQYIESSSPAEESKFNIPDSSSGVGAVWGVCHVYNGQKTTSGTGAVRGSLFSNGTESQGANNGMAQDQYTRFYDYYKQDPATTADWLGSALALLDIQYSRTA